MILNPHDTIVLGDSIIVKSAETADVCRACVNEAATNWADVEIVKCICIAFVLVALIVSMVVCLCYQKQVSARQKQMDFDNEQKKLENQQRLQIEKERFEESKKSSSIVEKTKSDCALEILKAIASLAKNKEDKADAATAAGLCDLYDRIKNGIDSDKNDK